MTAVASPILKHAVCIDAWKLGVFSRVLDYYGFKFIKNPGITDDTLTLSVETNSVHKLAKAVTYANERATYERQRRNH